MLILTRMIPQSIDSGFFFRLHLHSFAGYVSRFIVTLAVLLFLCAFPASAQLVSEPDIGDGGSPPQEAVQVGVLNNFPPFAFNVRGKLMGFTIDYLDLLAEKTAVSMDLHAGTWEEIYGRFRAGELDAITALSYTEEREDFTRFTEPYYRIPTVVYTREGPFEYKGVRDLTGKVVAIEKGVYYKEYLSEYEGIEIREIEDTDELMRALSFGEVDAVVTNINIGDYVIKQHLLNNVTLAGPINIEEIASEDLRIGVRRELPELAATIRTGMDRVSPLEYSELQDRWVSFSTDDLQDILLPEERTLLSEYEDSYGGVRVAAVDDFHPVQFIDGQGSHAGIVPELLQLVSEKHGIPFTPKPTNSVEASLEALFAGELDLIPAIVPSPYLRERLSFSKPYLSLPLVIATRSSEFFVGDPRTLEKRRVGIYARGDLRSVLQNKYPELVLQPVESVRDGLERVRDGEDFGFIGSIPEIAYAIQEHDFYNIKVSGRLEEERTFSAAVAPGNEELLRVVEKALLAVGEEERQSVINRWISVNLEERIDRRILWQAGIVIAVIGVMIAVWLRSVHKYNDELSAAYKLLEEKNRELETLSVTNRLTGLFNRGKLDWELDRELERAERYDRGFSLIMFDIDGFKSINDRFGHQKGDEILIGVAEVIRDRVRGADIPGRWGGEEFMLLCPETTRSGAVELAETLRNDIEGKEFGIAERVTASFGVAEYRSGERREQLIERVDRGLYEAKRLGKNRVVHTDAA